MIQFYTVDPNYPPHIDQAPSSKVRFKPMGYSDLDPSKPLPAPTLSLKRHGARDRKVLAISIPDGGEGVFVRRLLKSESSLIVEYVTVSSYLTLARRPHPQRLYLIVPKSLEASQVEIFHDNSFRSIVTLSRRASRLAERYFDLTVATQEERDASNLTRLGADIEEAAKALEELTSKIFRKRKGPNLAVFY